MKVWGFGNFYSNLERASQEGSGFSLSYFALVLASALLATLGLLADSVAVIIGSMCIAPFLGPSRAVSIGAIYKKWKIVAKALIKQLCGLLVIGSTVAFLANVALIRLSPEITVTPEILARTLPTPKDVYFATFIAVLSGFVASFVLVATPKMSLKPYHELPLVHNPRLLDATIGVEIAISLIPPASVVGIALAFGAPDMFLHALALLMINVVGLDITGMIVLRLWGVTSKPLQLEKTINKTIKETINAQVEADAISTKVILHSYEKADIHVTLRAFEAHDHTYRLLAERTSEEVKRKTGVSNSVRIIVTSVSMHESSDYAILVPDVPEYASIEEA
ncbi:DUF389 domain-containing protein [Candidatus Bathyarchaeota archaeon]|nr:DUF389 domain-containing protein [Candidatus Bathyarchaeota archaeon]